MRIEPALVRAVLAKHEYRIGKPVLMVVPGAGPLYATVLRQPGAADLAAGRQASIHLSVPTVARYWQADPEPFHDRRRIDGRNKLLDSVGWPMSPEEIEEHWFSLADAYRQAVSLPASEFNPDAVAWADTGDLGPWAWAHGMATKGLKSGDYPGYAQIAESHPNLHAEVLAAVDDYQRRVIARMEHELFAAMPDLYPAEPGWLRMPAAFAVDRIEDVPLSRLLRDAPIQADSLVASPEEPEVAYSNMFSMDY